MGPVNECFFFVFFFLQELDTRYLTEREELQKKQMKDLERLEQQQMQEYKNKSKQLRQEQVNGWYILYMVVYI